MEMIAPIAPPQIGPWLQIFALILQKKRQIEHDS